MRIAYILPGFSESETDWAIPSYLHLAKELSNRHQLSIFSLRYPSSRKPYQIHGATVWPLGYGTRSGAHRFLLLTEALATIVRVARQQRFEIVHGCWADEPGFLAMVTGHLLRIPSIVSLRGGELVGFPDIGYGGQLSRANRVLIRLALRHADCVTVDSQFLGQLAKPYVKSENLLMLPSGVETTLFTPAPFIREGIFSQDKVNLLHVGSLSPIKGHAALLQAFAQVTIQIPNAHLHLIGEGPLHNSLIKTCQRLQIDKLVTLHGAVPHDQLPAYYQMADLFVLSSLHESQCLALMEAAACGCPVVGTAVGILPDLVDPDALAPVGDANRLASVILNMLQNPDRLKALGERVQEKVRSEYNLNQTIAQLEEVYSKAIAKVQILSTAYS